MFIIFILKIDKS